MALKRARPLILGFRSCHRPTIVVVLLLLLLRRV